MEKEQKQEKAVEVDSRGGNQMSKCDEYRMKMDEIDDKIRQLNRRLNDWLDDPNGDKRESIHHQIERLELQLERLKDKSERCRGC